MTPYYPILDAPYCSGETTVHNFPPNNWEISNRNHKNLYVSFIEDNFWVNNKIDEIPFGKSKTIKSEDVNSITQSSSIKIISLSSNIFPEKSRSIPKLIHSSTSTPLSRATLSLVSDKASTCYQGEIVPFPERATLLSFSPFLQFHKGVENFLILLNFESNAQIRKGHLEIFDGRNNHLKETVEILSNTVNIISLNDINFGEESFPVFTSKDMASIPIYLSTYNQGSQMNIEHTHPPGSFAIHGNRFAVQKEIKRFWFDRLKVK